MSISNPQEPSDEQLAELVQKGNTETFGTLVVRYEQKLSRYGRKFLSDREDIKDIVQDIFLRSYENIKSFDPSMRFSSWIYRIAHNMFINHIKKKSRNPLVLVDLDTFLAHPVYEDPSEKEREQKEMEKMIALCLDQIPLKYREVLLLYYSEGLAYKDIADVLQIPQGTVGIRIQRGRVALRKACAEIGKEFL
jgi:RNA polymerase sigma-70 factor (ECF subfamily)